MDRTSESNTVTNNDSDIEPGRDQDSSKRAEPPLAKLQISILLLVLLCEPICATVIFPFVAKLVNELGVTHGDQAATGYYVGIIESLFFLAQGCVVLQWGRLSDKIGRRPVLIIGLAGLSASTLCFGLSRSFFGLVLSRAIAGVLNGNVGVAKTMMAELTPSGHHRAFVFSLFPITWIVGFTIAPLVGGLLQHPAERFPELFGSPFWKKYPYFLPCFLAACTAALGIVINALFLKETLPPRSRVHSNKSYQSLPTEPENLDEEDGVHPPKVEGSLSDVFVKPVFIAILNYGCLAILDIGWFAIMTVFLAVPVASGGLGLAPPKIGSILATLGLFSGAVQLIVFPRVYNRFGAKRVFIVGLTSFFIIFPMFPLMHVITRAFPTPDGEASPWVWAALAIVIISSPMLEMSYSCVFMYITAASPSPQLLGTTNGLAQTIISFTRALGPAGATTLFSLSVEHNIAGGYAVFWFFMLLTFVALGCASLLPSHLGESSNDCDE